MKSGMFVEENMSNLTSASNEASLSSSSNRNEIGTIIMYPPPPPQMQQSSFGSVPINQTQSNKKKRNLPGNPDPEAEVVALSPKSLMATNRFICEICNKGFQRDQNLQLHRRGHNLPWKLKQKSKLEVVRKKVYVCPEPSCVHHEASRALGDLTGIKKHFSRKHGEKKWKCDKCSKRYAVQSDWKAHSKICGTREYRCDCGTLFSRRDSFITHRAFCDALAEETAGRCSSSSASAGLNHLPLHLPINYNFPLKTEQQHLLQHPQLSSSSFKVIGSSSPHHNHQLPSWLDSSHQQQQQQQNPNPNSLHLIPSPAAASHMSATALLQKAAQMGVTISTASTAAIGSHQAPQYDHMCAPPALLSSQHHPSALLSSLSASDHNNNHVRMLEVRIPPNSSTSGFAAGCMDQLQLLHPNSLTSTSVGSTNIHEEIFINSMLNSTKKDNVINSYQEHVNFRPQAVEASKEETMMILNTCRKDGVVGAGGKDDELTRDFLGLRGFIPNNPTADDHHFLDNTAHAGLDDHMNHQQQLNQNQIPWQG